MLLTRSGVGILTQPLVITHQNSYAFPFMGLHWTNLSVLKVVCNSKCTYSYREFIGSKWRSTADIPHSYMAVNMQTDLQKMQGCSGRGGEPALIVIMPSSTTRQIFQKPSSLHFGFQLAPQTSPCIFGPNLSSQLFYSSPSPLLPNS